MTQEEKRLLFKDLCARLPYGVVIHTDWEDVKLDNDHRGIGMLYYKHYSEEAKKECGYDENDCSIIISGCFYGHNIKPYLRPMSSMTKEEWNNYTSTWKLVEHDLEDTYEPSIESSDWLISHHFDYRGLIEKGLALEARKEMYKEK